MKLTHLLFHRKSRTTFDTSDTRRAYGPIVIDYAKVQAKVTLKYDSWHKEALSKFGTLLGNEMQSFHSKVSKSRGDLEMQSIGEDFSNEIFWILAIVGLIASGEGLKSLAFGFSNVKAI